MTTPDWIAITSMVLTVVAIVLAPVVALWIGGKLQARAETRKDKLRVLATLLATRHEPLASDTVRSLNLIDVVFVDDFAVKEAWSRYYSVLSEPNLNNPAGFAVRDERRRDLLLEMVKSLQLAGKISSADILRTYAPQALNDQAILEHLTRQVTLAKIRRELPNLGIPDPMANHNANADAEPAPAQPVPAGPLADGGA